MIYKTHINGGLLAGLFINCHMGHTPILSTAVFLGGTFLGSIFPDIDHGNSYIGRKAKIVSKTINKIAGHRKLFHAPLMYLFLYSFGSKVISDPLILLGIKGIFIGILSHLILDSFTVGGLPWFYPFSKKKFCLLGIKTNGKLEDILCGMFICINIAIILDMLHITSIFRFTQI